MKDNVKHPWEPEITMLVRYVKGLGRKQYGEQLSKRKPAIIQQLDLRYSEVRELPDLKFLYLLHTLYLHGNYLTRFPENLPQTLTYVSLGNNLLESIEELRNVQLPRLRTLKLYCNHITEFRGLVKFPFAQLQLLELDSNPVFINIHAVTSLIAIPKTTLHISLESSTDTLHPDYIKKLTNKFKQLPIKIDF